MSALTLAERRAAYLDNYIPEPNTGCWLWLGKTNRRGYGACGYNLFGQELAHRAFYVHHVGPIPLGLLLRHKCDTRPCVNPDHLIPGTQAENMADMVRNNNRLRALGLYTAHARMPGEAHPNAKLNDELVALIRSSLESDRALARTIGVNPGTIGKVRRGESWAHLEKST